MSEMDTAHILKTGIIGPQDFALADRPSAMPFWNEVFAHNAVTDKDGNITGFRPLDFGNNTLRVETGRSLPTIDLEHSTYGSPTKAAGNANDWYFQRPAPTTAVLDLDSSIYGSPAVTTEKLNRGWYPKDPVSHEGTRLLSRIEGQGTVLMHVNPDSGLVSKYAWLPQADGRSSSVLFSQAHNLSETPELYLLDRNYDRPIPITQSFLQNERSLSLVSRLHAIGQHNPMPIIDYLAESHPQLAEAKATGVFPDAAEFLNGSELLELAR